MTSALLCIATSMGFKALLARPACIRMGFKGYHLKTRVYSMKVMQPMLKNPCKYKELLVSPPVSPPVNTPGVALVRSPVRIPVGTPVNPTACFWVIVSWVLRLFLYFWLTFS